MAASEDSSKVRHLTPTDYKATPWRNGSGRTTEIAISPPDASLHGGFDWRLSVAEVTADGPFSSFPGYDRNLTLLSGGGLLLDAGEEGDIELREPFKPVRFPGEWQVEGRLLGTAARDLNLITKRDTAAGRVGFLTIEGIPLQSESDAETLVLYVAEGGPVEVAWDDGTENTTLKDEEALILMRDGGGHALNLAAQEGAAKLAFVEISPKG